MRTLHDLDLVHVQHGQTAEIDRRAHAGEHPVAVEEHEHAASDAPRQAGGAADVHLAGVEDHALREGERLVEGDDVAVAEFVTADDGDAHRGLARPDGGAARRHGQLGNVEHPALEQDAELARPTALKLAFGDTKAVRDDDEGEGPIGGGGDPEAAIGPRRRAQRGVADEHGGPGERCARLRVQYATADDGVLGLGGERGARVEGGERRPRVERGEHRAHVEEDERGACRETWSDTCRYCRCQTVVAAAAGGSVTMTERTFPASVNVPRFCCSCPANSQLPSVRRVNVPWSSIVRDLAVQRVRHREGHRTSCRSPCRPMRGSATAWPFRRRSAVRSSPHR